jgi:protein subunit release factor A
MTDEELHVELLSLNDRGGQKVGTGRFNIRLTHLPTGMSVTISDKRGQHKGRAYALEMLKMMVGDFA